MARRPARALAVALLAVLVVLAALVAWWAGRGGADDARRIAVQPAGAEASTPRQPLAFAEPSERVAHASATDDPEPTAPPPPERQLPPPRCIDVLVLLDGEPAQGALVLVAGHDEGGLNRVAEPWDRGVRSAQTGADGWTRFAELPLDAFDVEARIDGLGAVRRRDVGCGRREGAVVVLELGTGAIEGRARNARGEAVADAWVEVAGDYVRRGARTDVAGAYRVGGLPAGSHMVMGPGGRHTALVFELAAGETKRVDFGSPHGRTTWRGVVRTASGARATGTWGVSVEPVRAQHEPIQGLVDAHAFQAAPDGSFEASLEPGRYRVFVAIGARRDSGEIEIGRVPLEHDIVIQGVTLTCAVAYTGRRLSREELAEVGLVLRRPGSLGSLEGCTPGPDGRYTFYALTPGRHVLRGYRLAIAGFPDGMPVEIDGQRSEVFVDVTLEDRR